MEKTPISTIIFDFDGTIADTFSTLIDIVNRNPKKFGINGIDQSEIPRLRGMSVKYLLEEFKIGIFRLPSFVKYLQKEMGKSVGSLDACPGMLELIKALHQKNIRLGILTSNSKSTVEKFLKQHNIDQYFDFVYSEKQLFGKHKALASILKKHKLDRHSVIYVGDEVRDIEASQRVGIHVIAVDWGFNTHEILEKHKPTNLVSNPNDILALL